MCVIIHAPAGKSLPKNILQNCYDHNMDGYGIMYAENGELKVIKKIGKFEEFYADWTSVPRGLERAIHFRFMTHGDVTHENCHPFLPVPNVGIMHNGVLDMELITPNMSDTFNFSAHLLQPLMKGMIDPSDHDTLHPVLSKLTEGSKLLVMNNMGESWITADDEWEYAYGCWFSNAYSMTPVHKSLAPYKGGYGGAYGSGYHDFYGDMNDGYDHYGNYVGNGFPASDRQTVVGSDVIGTLEQEISEGNNSVQYEIEDYIQAELGKEETITFDALEELSLEDMCDYVQDNPWTVTFMLRDLLGMDANADLVTNGNVEEEEAVKDFAEFCQQEKAA